MYLLGCKEIELKKKRVIRRLKKSEKRVKKNEEERIKEIFLNGWVLHTGEVRGSLKKSEVIERTKKFVLTATCHAQCIWNQNDK